MHTLLYRNLQGSKTDNPVVLQSDLDYVSEWSNTVTEVKTRHFYSEARKHQYEPHLG